MATYYVATPAAGGSNGNPGTFASPWASWDYGFNQLLAGDTLYIRGGTYTTMRGLYGSNYYGVRVGSSVHGESGNPIRVLAYNNEVPILDCTSLVSSSGEHYGVMLDDTHDWEFLGLTVCNVAENTNHSAPAKAWEHSSGASNMTLTRCTAYLCGNGFTNGADNVYYINCDSYSHHDFVNNGGLSNGFNCNIAPGFHVYYEGCRSWGNSDDGFDYYGADGYISTINCWAFENGPWSSADTDANGDGIKTGSASGAVEAGVQRLVQNCLSWSNYGAAFNESVDSGTKILHHVYNNTAWNNNYSFNFWAAGVTDIIRNNISHANVIALGDTGEGTVNTVDHNSWQNGLTLNDGSFLSVDPTGTKGARQSDGSLPSLNFLKLASGSEMIDAGVDVGLPYSGSAPDIGAYEYSAGTVPVTSVTVSGTGGATTISVDNGTLQMIATVLPSNATDKTVVWSVINGTGEATISAAGLLTAVKNGTVTVKATANG